MSNDTINHGGHPLVNAAISAVKWSYAGTTVKFVGQMVANVILARLLGPEPFGLLAVAWIVIGLGTLISDLGLGSALIQQRNISDDDIRYVFTWQVMVGIFMTLGVASVAGLVAQVFRQGSLVPVVKTLSIIFFLQALGHTSISLLKRNLLFKRIQVGQVISYFLAYVGVGVSMAYLGYGVWSLVTAQVTQSALFAAISYAQVRHPIQPLLTYRSHRKVLSFGSTTMLTNLVNWTINNMDTAFMGKVFGVANLGLYNRAFVLLSMPTNNIVTVLQGVLFPAYSRSQDEVESFRRVYLASIGLVALATLPVFSSIVIISGTVVEAIYGKLWLDVVPLAIPLAIAMPFYAIMALAGPAIWGRGMVGRELRAQVVVAAMFLVVLGISARASAVAVAWGVCLVYALRCMLLTREALKVVQCSWYDAFGAVRGALVISVFDTALVWGINIALIQAGASALVRLVVEALVGSAGALWLALAHPGMVFSKETTWLLQALSRGLPNVIRCRLEKIVVPVGR